ncbi:hypothetical protein [Nocardia barduliensis]|uniref:hypothetical protein n=1 Tax=Nocardia barduliensis TaxID=2736643 RepID=UPI0015745427|nr:hypothetical protein [Nocardia barduliensis]
MSDPLADAVPEADLAEQSVPAYPEQPIPADDLAEDEDTVGRAILERDILEANPADVIEQSIAVPIDDHPEDDLDY